MHTIHHLLKEIGQRWARIEDNKKHMDSSKKQLLKK
jgi:hypothetical protein